MDKPNLYAQAASAFSTANSHSPNPGSGESTDSHLSQPTSLLKVAKKAKIKPIVAEPVAELIAEPKERLTLLPNLAYGNTSDDSSPVPNLQVATNIRRNAEQAIELLQQGNQQLQQGAIDAAIHLYRQSLENNPESVEAYQHLAQALSKQGNLEEAAVCYRKAIEITTAHGMSRNGVSEASAAPQIGTSESTGLVRVRTRTEETESLTRVKSLPWYEEAAFHLQQGKVQCNLKNWDAAVTACERAIELMGPKTAEAYQLLGQALQNKGCLEDAKQSYTQAITLQPETAEVYAYLGSVYAEQGQIEEAANCYRQAIERRPNFAGAYWELGEIHQKSGDRSQATDCWYKALQLEPSWATAKEHWRLGTALAEQNKLDQAVSSYRQAIQFDPAFSEAYHNLGVILGKQRKWQEALNYHQQAVQIGPDKPQIWAGLGRALSALERWEEAIAAYHQVTKIKLDGKQGYAIFQHALVQLEQCQKALVACSYYDVAEGLSQQEKWQEAISCYQQAIERNPNSAQFHASLGKALAAVNLWQEAIAAYQQAMELAPEQTEYYLAFGDVLIRREKLQKQQMSRVEQTALHTDLKNQQSVNAIVKENNKTQNSEERLFTLL